MRGLPSAAVNSRLISSGSPSSQAAKLGEAVAVIGLGLLGQLTVQILKAAGCRVIGIDLDRSKVELAMAHGADAAVPRDGDVESAIAQFTGGFGLFIQAGGWTAFQNEVNQYAAQGWMLEDLDAASNGGPWTNHVAVLNEAQGSSQQLIRENSFASFHANWLAHQGGGLRLTDIDVANVNGQPLFYGLMRPGTNDERLIHETTLANFHAVRTAMEGNGWRIRDIAMQQGEYLAVLYPGSGPTITETFADWAGLVDRWGAIDGNRRVNTRLKDVECWVEGGELRYAGLWRGTLRVRRPEGAVPPNVVATPNVTPPPSPQPGRPAAERDPN